MSISNNLTLEEVTVQLGPTTILQDLSITFEAGKIYTIVGPSGTGKSTLLNTVAGLCSIQSGTMTAAGQPYDPKQHVVSLVPQNYGLLPWETAWKTVTSAVKMRTKQKLTQSELQKIEQLFEQMNLMSVKDKYPSAMSGGQQQRVSLARGFAVQGELLLMDEPFSALDAFTREKIQALFLETWARQPQTTLFITHDIEEALLLGQKIVVMGGQPGQIRSIMDNPLTSGTLAEKRSQPRFYEWVETLRKEIRYEEA